MRKILGCGAALLLGLSMIGCGSTGGGPVPVEQESAEFEAVMDENAKQGGG